MTILLPLAGAGAGAIVGSFLATLCIRWPRGEQVLAGRSKCDGCQRSLSPYELVPIASGLIAGGKCRTCGARIASLHFWTEAAAAGLAASALLLQPNAAGAALAIFWLLLLAPAILDARHLWLPDRLLLPLALAGVAFGALVSGTALPDRLIGGAAGFASLALLGLAYRKLRRRDGLGLGDAKLLGAIGLWTGWAALPPILLIASTIGLIAAAALGRQRFEQMPLGTLLAIAAIAWSVLAQITPDLPGLG